MNERKNVNYIELAGTSKVVILGETSHANRAFQHEVVRALGEFKKAGFSHLGIEMLPTGSKVSLTEKMITQIISYYYATHELVFREAKRLNLTIVPLDIPYDIQNGDYNNQDAKLYLDRNHWMAREAIKVLSKGHKMVLFMHFGHAMSGVGNLQVPDKNGVHSLLKAKGFNAVNIQLGGGGWESKVCSGEPRFPESIEAQEHKVQNSRFSVAGGAGVDYFVHLPQNCKIR